MRWLGATGSRQLLSPPPFPDPPQPLIGPSSQPASRWLHVTPRPPPPSAVAAARGRGLTPATESSQTALADDRSASGCPGHSALATASPPATHSAIE